MNGPSRTPPQRRKRLETHACGASIVHLWDPDSWPFRGPQIYTLTAGTFQPLGLLCGVTPLLQPLSFIMEGQVQYMESGPGVLH